MKPLWEKLRPEVRLAILWAVASVYLTVLIGLLFNPLDFSHAKEFTELGIAVFGGVFAILAMMDAHRAFRKAKEVEEAVGSFRMSFEAVMEEMLDLVQRAKGSLCMLIPTPAYGYLFGEPALSNAIVTGIEAFVQRDDTHLELYLVFGSQSQPPKLLLPQRYLKRAYDLQKDVNGGVSADVYTNLVERVFNVIRKNPNKAELRILNSDPNVRIIIADPDNPEQRACLLSFAQSDPGDITKKFQSTGFRSTRSEMVRAVRDLISVYSSEQSEAVAVDSVRTFYVIRK